MVLAFVDGAAPGFDDQYERAHGHPPLDRCHTRTLGELRYVLRSIERFADWVRDVVLVVADEGHVPSWLNRNHVRIVTHAEYMPGRCLPSFNPSAILGWAYQIEGLAEHFILWSDDQLALRPTKKGHFFSETGSPLPPKHGASIWSADPSPDPFAKRVDNSFRAFNTHFPEIARRGGGRFVSHAPHPIAKDWWMDFLQSFEVIPGFRSTIEAPIAYGPKVPPESIALRELWSAWLYGQAPLDPGEPRLSIWSWAKAFATRLRPSPRHRDHFSIRNDPEWTSKQMRALMKSRASFVCLADDASDDYLDPDGRLWEGNDPGLPPASAKVLQKSLDTLFPQASRFEA